jgi:hypothetical protein
MAVLALRAVIITASDPLVALQDCDAAREVAG